MGYIPVNIDKSIEKECKRRRYSERTTKTYLCCINKFLRWCNKDLGKISKMDVRLFLEKMSEEERSGNTMNVYHMAIRFLFENSLKKKMWVNIRYSKVPEKLPIVLTKEEIKKLFESIENYKHKLMVQLMYSSGLRVSELLNLKIKDLEENYGFVRRGKGNKDRIFIIATSLKDEIKSLIEKEKLDGGSYLFKSNRNKKFSARTLQQILKKAAKTSKIIKEVHPHTLRHSFATHLIENGYTVSDVQSLLGHKSPETSMIYVHTAKPNMIKIKSPIDNL